MQNVLDKYSVIYIDPIHVSHLCWWIWPSFSNFAFWHLVYGQMWHTVNVTAHWMEDQLSASVVNQITVTDCTMKQSFTNTISATKLHSTFKSVKPVKATTTSYHKRHTLQSSSHVISTLVVLQTCNRFDVSSSQLPVPDCGMTMVARSVLKCSDSNWRFCSSTTTLIDYSHICTIYICMLYVKVLYAHMYVNCAPCFFACSWTIRACCSACWRSIACWSLAAWSSRRRDSISARTSFSSAVSERRSAVMSRWMASRWDVSCINGSSIINIHVGNSLRQLQISYMTKRRLIEEVSSQHQNYKKHYNEQMSSAAAKKRMLSVRNQCGPYNANFTGRLMNKY